MNNKKIILHIPHSSTLMPNYKGFIVSKAEISDEINVLTDWYVDEIFNVNDCVKVVTPFSRVFCDVERFHDDSKEIMSQFGMGAVYTHGSSGKVIRILTDELRNYIIQDYYVRHHDLITNEVEQQLFLHETAIIIDCHSFPENPHQSSINKSGFRPDICIGTDDFHTPEYLIQFTVDFFKSEGFAVLVDFPYSGTMIPSKFYKKDKRVKSLMIEINRKLYLDDDNNKTEKFKNICGLINKYLGFIEYKF